MAVSSLGLCGIKYVIRSKLLRSWVTGMRRSGPSQMVATQHDVCNLIY